MHKISRINTKNTSRGVWILSLMQEVHDIYMQTCYDHKHAPFLYRRMQYQIPTYRKILQERDNERRC